MHGGGGRVKEARTMRDFELLHRVSYDSTWKFNVELAELLETVGLEVEWNELEYYQSSL
jgi:hypothetical protein